MRLSRLQILVLSILILLVVAAAIVFALYPTKSISYKNTVDESLVRNDSSIQFGSQIISVRYAETFEDRALGYSGTQHIPMNEGLVFVFEAPGRWSMWMKDMLVPLDIVWLDETGKVVHVETGVAPETYPEQAFTPNADARYVIEVASGTVASSGLMVGDIVKVRGTQQQ
ncbi:MAG TPA: DUF192 domain-containing protein [Candidatus Paceibacterota bacterium]|nr:DUF192 domain-containing protein [Candidatus Paceibacterota bacterium]